MKQSDTMSQHPEDSRKSRFRIRHSTKADLKAIHQWLQQEEAKGVHDNFLCNWEIIEKAHRDRKLLVYIDGPTGAPVGFRSGGLVGPGILQVHSDYRRQGIGRTLVERCVAMAEKENCCFLYIQCKPSSSIEFWKRMGFTLIPGDPDNHAYRVLEKHYPLPENGRTVEVVIRFYPEDRKWREILPYKTYKLPAKQTSDGIVHLPERVLFFRKLYREEELRDPMVEIKLDGKCLYLDKAKYPEARQIGVQWCHHGFFIDRLRPEAAIKGAQADQ